MFNYIVFFNVPVKNSKNILCFCEGSNLQLMLRLKFSITELNNIISGNGNSNTRLVISVICPWQTLYGCCGIPTY